MKKLLTIHNGVEYEFRLLEAVRVIEVIKGGRFTYTIRWASSFFRCDCPGGVYRGKCWHLAMITKLKQYPSIEEPWALWAEDAGRMQYGKL